MSTSTTGSPRTMTARRARIATIIATTSIGSQEELGAVLAADGFHVTQATLSRDLDAIGALKSLDEGGRQHYSLSDQAASDTSIPSVESDAALARTAAELVVRAEAAGNIVVVHTPPGAAQFLAGQLDRSTVLHCVGSVAGDDTIIIVMRTPDDAVEYCTTIITVAEQRRNP